MRRCLTKSVIVACFIFSLIIGVGGLSTIILGLFRLASNGNLSMVNPFPSYLEHRGMYNINPEDYLGEEPDNSIDTSWCVQSVKPLPPLTWSEFQKVSSAIYRALEQHGRLPGMSEQEAKVFYRYCVGDELTDRTARVELPRFEVLTPALIEALQRNVLSTYPLWRIFIVAESPETVVIIYPTAVRLGTVPIDGNWKAALPEIVSKVLEIRQEREGPQQRQREYLRSRIPSLVRELRDNRPQLVAAFDNHYLGDKGDVSVWLLYPGEDEWFDISIVEPKNIAVGEKIAVKADGMFDDYYVFDPDRQPAFRLEQWVLPPDFKGNKLVLEKTRPGRVVEARWTINFDHRSIIKDADLKVKR
jgi:hypothetical protein